jgi:uncharacterized protein with PIN domain
MGFLRSFVRELILRLLVILIAGYFGLFFSIDISAFLGIQTFLWNNALGIILFVLTVLIMLRAYQVAKRVKSVGPLIYVPKNKPERIIAKFIGTFYDVRWRMLYGTYSIYNPAYIYVEGPYCPQCDYELDTKTGSTFLGLKVKHIWYCAQCKKDYKRKRDYPNEEDVVEKRVEAGLRSENVRLYQNESFKEVK